MRRLATLLPVFLLLLLSACDESDRPPPATLLPEIPADIRACFVGVVEIPRGALTVGDVERLWKSDRVRAIAMQRCGGRLLTFYDHLRRTWR